VRNLLIVGLVGLGLVLPGCVVPRLIWPQSDIRPSEINAPTAGKNVLVASRKSEFKDAVVARIGEAFRNKPVHIKFIGLDDLDKEDAGRYDALVLMDTCIAWGLDRKVDAFLGRNKDAHNIIVLTTSGDGKWVPKKDGRSFDAIASASEKASVAKIADSIVAKVEALLDHT
jgi:hypothetical protein